LIIIRKFEPQDFQGVIELERLVFNEHDPYMYMQFYETFPETFIVAKLDGIIIGYIAGFITTPNTGRVFSLAVHPAYQNRRIGGFLLSEIVTTFRNFGVFEIILEVRETNLKAKRFYERHGFVKTGSAERYYFDGENALLMRLTLKN